MGGETRKLLHSPQFLGNNVRPVYRLIDIYVVYKVHKDTALLLGDKRLRAQSARAEAHWKSKLSLLGWEL